MEARKASTAQIRMLYGTARRCSMDNDDLHALVKVVTGRESIRELTVQEATRAIDYLLYKNGLGKSNILGRATENQRRYIVGLAREVGMLDEPKHFRQFLEKRFGVADIAFLDEGKTQAVITALKAMKRRKKASTEPQMPDGR